MKKNDINEFLYKKDNAVVKEAMAERQKKYRERKKRKTGETTIEFENSETNEPETQACFAQEPFAEESEINFFENNEFHNLEAEYSEHVNQVVNDYFCCNDQGTKSFLYPDSEISLRDFLAGLFSIKSKHKLNDKCVDDILYHFKLSLPKPNNCPLNSSKAFKKRFNFEEDDAKVFYLCTNCEMINEEDKFDDLGSKNLCSSCSENEIDTFVVFNIEKQLEKLLLNSTISEQILNFRSNLNSFNQMSKLNIGKIYSEVKLKIEINYISLVVNTDGAPITAFNSYSMWPVLATIVKLEPNSRESFPNMLVLGKIFQIKYY